MPVARLSGKVGGIDDPNRRLRANLLYRLFAKGWDIYNGNGDQVVTLRNIQKKIRESDAFIFTPGATLEDMFKASSIFVGYQTIDGDLKHKPTVLMNPDESWTPFFALIDHLYALGTVPQKTESFFQSVNTPKEVLLALKDRDHSAIENITVMDQAERELLKQDAIWKTDQKRPSKSVCVFCSASSKKPQHLEAGKSVGEALAQAGLGCISGAGSTGVMGRVVQGAKDAGGWTGGSNVPRIIALEGLPDDLDVLWPRADIYTRMEVMIEQSDAFIILPGGVGTLQELLALVLLKAQGHKLMKGKPIIVVNEEERDGVRFWDPALVLFSQHNKDAALCTVVNDHRDAVKTVSSLL